MSYAIRKELMNFADGNGCHNAGLALERYLKGHDDINIDGNKLPGNHYLFENVIQIAISNSYIRAFERWSATVKSLDAKSSHFKTLDRLIVGLGGESVLETAIILNRTYGVPIIPGSALKGLTRHYFLQKIAEYTEHNEKKELKKEYLDVYNLIFGNTDSAGYITFFDAWYDPASGSRPLQRDVMTPHHMSYYSQNGKDTYPTDFDDPNPVSFVSAAGSYLVAISGPTPEWNQYAFDILTRALRDYGVGGKTSSGYGRLVPMGSIANSEVEVAQQPARLPQKSQLVMRIEAIPGKQIANSIYNYYLSWQKLDNADEKLAVAKALLPKLKNQSVRTRWEGKPLAEVEAYIALSSNHVH